MPDLLDDDVTDENPVRFIDADVASLALMSLGFARAQAARTGRPADDPRDLLKLYIYGDFNRIRSSRRLARETHRHVERIWLLRQLRPDVKTMADFRKNNPTALQALFRECVLLGKQLALFGAELLAIDGSQCKAVNNTHKHFTQAQLEKALQAIDEQVEQYLRDLDAAERAESSVHPPTSEALQKKIENLQERQKRDRGCVEDIAARGEPPRPLTDPERRSMPKSPKVDAGDHVQIAVDSQHQLIVAQEVTHAVPEDDLLSPMAIQAKETLGVERIRAVADLGSDHGHELNACDEAGIDADGPKPYTAANTTLGLVGKEPFTDAPPQDGDRCPRGEELPFRLETTALGRHIRYDATGAGRSCPMKEQCTRNNGGRRIPRGVDEHILERMQERLKANPAIMQERKPLVEQPFGTIKHAKDQGDCLMKGLKNVRAEFSLSCLAYNLKRVINIRGVPQLLGALSDGGHRRAVCPQ